MEFEVGWRSSGSPWDHVVKGGQAWGFTVAGMLWFLGVCGSPTQAAVDPAATRTAIALRRTSESVSADGIAPLYMLGKGNDLEECQAQAGLSVRPWDGRDYRDYTWVHTPGNPFALRVAASPHPGVDRWVLAFWDWHGRVVARRDYRGAEAAGLDEMVTVAVSGLGTWLITFDACAGDELRSRLVRSIGVVPDVTEARRQWAADNDYVLGSCFFPRRYYRWGPWFYRDRAPYPDLSPAEAVDRVVGLAARCGLSILRIDYCGRPPHKPTWGADWAVQEEILSILRKHGVQADLKLRLFPQCFTGATLDLEPEVFGRWQEDFRYLVDHVIAPRDTVVGMVELGNEPAHHEFWAGTREQYQWLVRYGSEAIRAVRPDMMVVHGGTCPPGADLAMRKREEPDEYERVKALQTAWYDGFRRDLAPDAPVWAYHWHGALTMPMLDWRTAEERALRDVGFDGVFVQTEGGSCAWRPDREVSTWVEVMQKILYSWSRGEAGWLQYNLAFHAQPSRYTDNGWSMIHGHVFAPRFLYGAMAGMVQVMAGCTLDRIIMQDRVEDAFRLLTLFDHPEGKMLAGYAQSDVVELDVFTNGEAVLRFDAMGNQVDEQGPGSLALDLGPEPVYVLLRGADSVSVRQQAAAGAGPEPRSPAERPVSTPDLGPGAPLLEHARITVHPDTLGPGVSPFLTGFNLSYFSDLDSVWADGRIAGYLKRIGAGLLRYPGGEETSRYHWQHPGARGYLDVWDEDGFMNREKGWRWSAEDRAVDNPDHMDTLEFLGWCERIGAEPMLGVNVSSGITFDRFEDSLEEIRHWYDYCREHGYRVTMWYVDNEPWHHGTYQHMDVETYAQAVTRVSVLLKGLDPDVTIVCNPVSAGWWQRLETFLRLCGEHVDVIDLHWYWNWGNASFDSWLAATPMTADSRGRDGGHTYADEIRRFRELARSLGHDHIQLAAHEWNVGPAGDDGRMSPYMHALITAEMMFQFAEGGLHSACMWPLQWVWDREKVLREIADGTYRPPRFQDRSIISQTPPHEPLPTLQSFALLSRMLGGTVVAAESTAVDLPMLAVRKGSDLLVYVLNKSGAERQIALAAAGGPLSSVARYETLCADDIESASCTLEKGTCGTADGALIFRVPGHSLSLVSAAWPGYGQ